MPVLPIIDRMKSFIAKVTFSVSGHEDLLPRLIHVFEYEHLTAGSGRLDRCHQSGSPAADNDEIPDIFLYGSFPGYILLIHQFSLFLTGVTLQKFQQCLFCMKMLAGIDLLTDILRQQIIGDRSLHIEFTGL